MVGGVVTGDLKFAFDAVGWVLPDHGDRIEPVDAVFEEHVVQTQGALLADPPAERRAVHGPRA